MHSVESVKNAVVRWPFDRGEGRFALIESVPCSLLFEFVQRRCALLQHSPFSYEVLGIRDSPREAGASKEPLLNSEFEQQGKVATAVYRIAMQLDVQEKGRDMPRDTPWQQLGTSVPDRGAGRPSRAAARSVLLLTLHAKSQTQTLVMLDAEPMLVLSNSQRVSRRPKRRASAAGAASCVPDIALDKQEAVRARSGATFCFRRRKNEKVARLRSP